jgi:Flp pilus assembly secretin CpaC
MDRPLRHHRVSSLNRSPMRTGPGNAGITGVVIAMALSAFIVPTAATAQAPSPVRPVVAPVPAVMDLTVITSQHRRLIFPSELARIAVGDSGIAEGQLISNREMLLLGVAPGRTTLIVWFVNGTIQQYAVNVQRDLSLLATALKRLDASIDIEIAPDRDALVLTGTVPDVTVSQTAEAIARDYLGAGAARAGAAARPMVQASPAAVPDAAAAGDQSPQAPAAPNANSTPAAPAQIAAPVPASSAVINLLRLAALPPMPEDKIRAAIAGVGGDRVTVRRVLRGAVRDDGKDTLVLEGTVPNQVALVRVLEVAGQVVAQRTMTLDDIRVVADEAGALTTSTQNTSQTSQGGLGSSLSGLGGGGARSNTRLNNQIERNIGRAKAIEVAGGRIVSFIDVADLPQVRIDIRLFEVSRSKLLSYSPQALLSLSTKALPPIASAIDGAAALSGNAAENVLGFLNGQGTNQTQLVSRHAAIDATLSLLEREGIARSLSSPSLTVLSGEQAQFQVGGDIPVPVAFAPAFGGGATTPGTTPGVFSSVEFVPFGIQLSVRPLVDDADAITLDLQPQIVNPSADLTASIRSATGTSQSAPAFETRGLRTSARLQDGQSLVIGGLLSNTSTENTQRTPGLGSIPGVGWLFKGLDRNDQSTELVIIVSPSVIRPPAPMAALWVYPQASEILNSLVRAAAPDGGR